MATVFHNGRILVGEGFREDLAVLVEGEHITAVTWATDAALAGLPRHDLGGAMLVPGFIDTQVNGGGGVLFNDAPTEAGARRIAQAHRAFGTTALLPTLISDRREVMARAIDGVQAAIDAGAAGVLGIHLEGPWLAAERRGVHDARHFHAPDADDLALATRLRGGPTLVTLAPERVAPEAIAGLAAAGVIVAAGHTAASFEQVQAALAAGLRGFTHLYNAMPPLHSREPGPLGAALLDEASWCGLIVDGHHLHPASLRLALRAKPRSRLFLVTDAMSTVGTTLERFTLGEEEVFVRNGRVETATGTLAGSALDMASAVRNTVAQAGIPLADALLMASTWPADFLGLPTHGRIAPGARADLVCMDENVRIRRVWVGGREVD